MSAFFNKKTIFFIVFFLFNSLLISLLFSKKNPTGKDQVDIYVTIAPYKYFVDRISNYSVHTAVLVPQTASPHSFEPTAKDILSLSHADLWLLSGEPFEKKLIESLQTSKSSVRIYDMREGIPLLPSQCGHDHQRLDLKDPHIWLSPLLAKRQVTGLLQQLITLYPDKQIMFEHNASQLIEELDMLYDSLSHKLATAANTSILVSHGAFAYFCRDFNLHQLMIESKGGQEPTAQELTKLIQTIKEQNIQRILSQIQYNKKATKRLATTLHIDLVEVNPYSENYFENMHYLARIIAQPNTNHL